jgi:hypothetical protein
MLAPLPLSAALTAAWTSAQPLSTGRRCCLTVVLQAAMINAALRAAVPRLMLCAGNSRVHIGPHLAIASSGELPGCHSAHLDDAQRLNRDIRRKPARYILTRWMLSLTVLLA